MAKEYLTSEEKELSSYEQRELVRLFKATPTLRSRDVRLQQNRVKMWKQAKMIDDMRKRGVDVEDIM